MKDSTKRLLLIGGSLVVIGGVIYYFYNQSKGEDVIVTDIDEERPEGTASEGATSTANQGSSVGVSPAVNLPAELNSADKVKKFQDFMDALGPWIKGADNKYKKLNKGTGYGNAGSATKSAFNVYGDLYRVFIVTYPKGRVVPRLGAGSQPSIDVELSNGHIARYQLDKKFVDFGKNYGSADNVGTWSNNGRKLVLTYGPKKGIISHNSIWDTFKTLIS